VGKLDHMAQGCVCLTDERSGKSDIQALYRPGRAPMIEPSEAYTIVERRGGKSFISALTAVHVSCFRDYQGCLNAGQDRR
jgi:hypothetical protein